MADHSLGKPIRNSYSDKSPCGRQTIRVVRSNRLECAAGGAHSSRFHSTRHVQFARLTEYCRLYISGRSQTTEAKRHGNSARPPRTRIRFRRRTHRGFDPTEPTDASRTRFRACDAGGSTASASCAQLDCLTTHPKRSTRIEPHSSKKLRQWTVQSLIYLSRCGVTVLRRGSYNSFASTRGGSRQNSAATIL